VISLTHRNDRPVKAAWGSKIMEQKSGGNDKDRSHESTDVPVIELTDVVEKGPEALEKSSTAEFAGNSGESEGSSKPAQSFTLPREDFSGLLDDGEDEFAFTEYLEDEGPSEGGESFPIDEKRLEVIVSRVVAEVVERVTRETVARVTEKVLTAAIEAIKDNLEKPSN
jgi:hypothetical protein